MKVGDLVGRIENEWMLQNPWINRSSMFRELFPKVELFGVIVEVNRPDHIKEENVAWVLTQGGNVVKIKKDELEVINESTK